MGTRARGRSVLRWVGKGLLVLILVAAVSAYLIPVPKMSLADLYAGVDEATVQSLVDFRARGVSTLEVNGASWTYYAGGQGPRAILFLHGMAGAYDIWWQQLSGFEEDFRVVSVTYPPLHSLGDLSRGVLAILEKEGLRKVNVVGTSLGGYLAQYLAAEHPEVIEKAVFANTFPPNDIIREENKTIGPLLPCLPAWLVLGQFRRSVLTQVVPAANGSELVRAYQLEQSYGGMTKDQFVARFHCVIDPFEAPDPVASGIEVMIIESDNDPLVEARLREMLRETYPSAAVHTFHGTGHFPYLNEPAQYAEVLSDFFGQAQGNPGEEGAIAPVLPQDLDPGQVVRFYDNGETREMSLADLVELVGAATRNPRAYLGPGWWLSPGYAARYFTLDLLGLAWQDEDWFQTAAGGGNVVSDGQGAVRGVYMGTHHEDATSESARVTLETADEKAYLITLAPAWPGGPWLVTNIAETEYVGPP